MRNWCFWGMIQSFCLCLVSCWKDDGSTIEPPAIGHDGIVIDHSGNAVGSTTISLPASSIQKMEEPFPLDGGSRELSFYATEDWSINLADSLSETRADISWCTVSPTSGSKGQVTITITIQKNETYEDRTVVLYIKAGEYQKKILITQKQVDYLAVEQHEITANGDSTFVEIGVKSNIGYTCKISKFAEDWIKQVETRSVNSTKVILALSRNPLNTSRQGKVTISSGSISEVITIIQNAMTEKDLIKGLYAGGAIIQLDDVIQPGSKLNWSLYNNSQESITVHSLQLLGDSQESSVMSIETSLETGKNATWTVTVGEPGVKNPVARFVYTYKDVKYYMDITYENSVEPVVGLYEEAKEGHDTAIHLEIEDVSMTTGATYEVNP